MGAWWETHQDIRAARARADATATAAERAAAAKVNAAADIARARDEAAVERATLGRPRRATWWSTKAQPVVVTDHRNVGFGVGVPAAGERKFGGSFVVGSDGKIITYPRLRLHNSPEVAGTERFKAEIRHHAQVIADVRRRHPGLETIRDASVWEPVWCSAGLTVETVEHATWAGKYARGVRDDVRVTLPTVTAAHVAPEGLVLTVRPVPRAERVSVWQAAATVLAELLPAAGFTVGDLVVEPTPASMELHFRDTADRVPAAPKVSPPTGITPYDPVTGRSLLGVRVDDGSPAYITWRGNAGCIVGGVPGSGKTGSLLPVIAGLAGCAELHIFDGKGSYDLAVFEPAAATYDRSMSLDVPVATLERLSELVELRATAIHTATGLYDFWSVPPADLDRLGLVPIFLIIDEAQTWLTASGLTAAEKKVVERISGLIRGLIQRGRFAGITTILTTQRPSADIIPTSIRDIAANKLCFRTTTAAQAKTVLGDVAEDTPSPSAIPGSAKGQCVVVDDEGGAVMVQAGHADLQTLQARIGVRRPRDQFELAQQLAGGKG